MLKKYLQQAYKGVATNKTRTFLTTLGITIGIMTVIIVLSAGEGFKSYINAQMEAFGTNTISIETVVPKSTKQREKNPDTASTNSPAGSAVPVQTFKNKDIEDIKNIPNVRNAYGASIGQQVVSYKGVSKNVFLFGSDASRFDIDKGVVERGRSFTESENKALAQVAVLGFDLAKDLFGEEDPIGKLIRIGNYNFEVIGVYEDRGGVAFSNDNDQVFMPVRTLQKKIQGVDYLFFGIVELVDNDKAPATSEDIKEVLRRNHYITDPAKDDFRVATQEENMDTFNTILQAVTILLIAIATISLVVGGVGVMNIMYVAITERVGEIGLKKALGARNDDILYEFLFEAILLSLIGGAGGILFGALVSFGVAELANSFGFEWDFIVPIWGIVIAVSVSTAIGLFFGVFPAKNAARLDPIVALNKE